MTAESLYSQHKDESLENLIKCFEDMNHGACGFKEIHTIALLCVGLCNGGIEKIVSILSGKFSDAGYKVLLLTVEAPKAEDYPCSNKITRIVVPDYSDVEARMVMLEKLILQEKIDVIIENSWAFPSLIWEYMLLKQMEIPFVTYVHGNFSYPFSARNEFSQYIYRMIKYSDAVVCLDKASECFFSMIGSKCVRINNPIDDSLLKLDAKREVGKNRILWLGRLVEGKRFEDALKILLGVMERIPEIQMEVVGCGKQEKQMQKLARKMGVSENVHFRGFQNDVIPFFYANDVLLMTSESEGYPVSLVEAKATGIPVVMYELPYLAINDIGGGFVSAPVGDIELMVNKVVEVLCDVDKQRRMVAESNECFERIKEIDIVSEWKNVFNKLFQEFPNDGGSMEVINLMTQRYYRTFERYEKASKEIIIGKLVLAIPRKLKKK